jgi:hypothetical protein
MRKLLFSQLHDNLSQLNSTPEANFSKVRTMLSHMKLGGKEKKKKNKK